ncbi:hypothetical protein G6F56_009327 [Rhizopus delemar]|uniref:CCHC-type domain-containing protein n=1 Tax=Rhizopus stolonifer TaxID=4846 RepID=A0A367IYC3_RHIST|nr:hypothetical protein G6F56_009327 [Rhizopus delemar]RCH82656.1 hypothetical protein CU098_007695 [Rhizopus stolonifer]
MLIGHLKNAVNPDMAKAIIYRGPSTYDEAVGICIEIEAELQKLDATKTVYSPGYMNNGESSEAGGGSSGMMNGGVAAQNSQFHKGGTSRGGPSSSGGSGKSNRSHQIRCYRCNKKGHMKKDCYRNKINGGGFKQNQQDVQDNAEQEEDNIFSQFFQQNNEQVVTNSHTPCKKIFTMVVKTGNGEVASVLVDTGSTISTISEEMVQELGLERMVCHPETIQYGNKSTQVTAEKGYFPIYVQQR